MKIIKKKLRNSMLHALNALMVQYKLCNHDEMKRIKEKFSNPMLNALMVQF